MLLAMLYQLNSEDNKHEYHKVKRVTLADLGREWSVKNDLGKKRARFE